MERVSHKALVVAGTGSSTTSFKNRLPFTVKTLEDKYHVVFVTKGASNNNLYFEGVDDDEWMDEKWMSCEDEKKDGNISLIVKPLLPFRDMLKKESDMFLCSLMLNLIELAGII